MQSTGAAATEQPHSGNKPKTPQYSALFITISLAILTAAGTFARFYGISVRAMYDEAASWNIARLPWRSFWQALWDFEANMGLYYLILRPWLHLGNSEVVVRGLSVLFGVATIPVLYLVGSRLFSQRVGLMAAALLAVHAFHIRWSQEARSYALLVLLLTWSTLLLVSALQGERARGRWAGYIVLSALACYCHLFAVFVIAAQWLWIIVKRFPDIRSRIPGLICQVVLIAPAGLYAAFRNQGQLDWIQPLSARDLVELCRSWVGSAPGGYGMALLFCLYGLLCALGIVTGLGSGSRSRRLDTALPVLWAVVPSGAIILGSIVKPILVDRYLLPCLPALLLLVSLGIDFLLSRGRVWMWVGVSTTVAVLALNVHGSAMRYWEAKRVTNSNGLRGMSRYVLSHQEPGDAAIFFNAEPHLSFKYYAALAGATQTPKIVIPDYHGAITAAQDFPSQEEIRAAAAPFPRVWLILNEFTIQHDWLARNPMFHARDPNFHNALAANFKLDSQYKVGWFEISLYTRRK
ncbi:MAG TPA: glycosyltransferase family 39 protein [Bryobacteraceae bacterium]|nr:glycosyltransferase family 39 protein [Bryobacteraceae bacterium]